MWTIRVGGEKGTETSWLSPVFCGGWAQTLIEISVILGIQWPALSHHSGVGPEKDPQFLATPWHTREVE